MPTDVVTLFQEFIKSLVTDEEFAAQYAGDPTGTLAAQGITDADLSGVDIRQVVGDVCADPSVSPETREALQSYTSGGGSAGGHTAPSSNYAGTQSVEQVVQHLNYVTYATYQDDHSITTIIDAHDESTNIDNSVDVDGDVDGTLDIDNANATGAGSVAGNTEGGDLNAATGAQSQVIDGDVDGNANTGNGAVLLDDVSGDVGPINTGINSGIINDDGTVTNAVLGNDNEVAQVGPGSTVDDTVFSFGEGDVNQQNDNTLTDSALGGRDATNVSDNTVEDGSAIATGSGDASGSFEDNDQDNDTTETNTETTTIDADHSIVDTEQGDGDQENDNDNSDDDGIPD